MWHHDQLNRVQPFHGWRVAGRWQARFAHAKALARKSHESGIDSLMAVLLYQVADFVSDVWSIFGSASTPLRISVFPANILTLSPVAETPDLPSMQSEESIGWHVGHRRFGGVIPHTSPNERCCQNVTALSFRSHSLSRGTGGCH